MIPRCSEDHVAVPDTNPTAMASTRMAAITQQEAQAQYLAADR